MHDARARTNGDPAITLDGVLKDAFGRGLRAHYEPQEIIPHHLLVCLMQMREDEARAQRKAAAAHSGG